MSVTGSRKNGWKTLGETATLLGVSRPTLRKLIERAGVVPYAPGSPLGPKLLSRTDRRKLRAALGRPGRDQASA